MKLYNRPYKGLQRINLKENKMEDPIIIKGNDKPDIICKHSPMDTKGYAGKVTTCKFCGIALMFINPIKGKQHMSKKQRRKEHKNEGK